MASAGGSWAKIPSGPLAGQMLFIPKGKSPTMTYLRHAKKVGETSGLPLSYADDFAKVAKAKIVAKSTPGQNTAATPKAKNIEVDIDTPQYWNTVSKPGVLQANNSGTKFKSRYVTFQNYPNIEAHKVSDFGGYILRFKNTNEIQFLAHQTLSSLMNYISKSYNSMDFSPAKLVVPKLKVAKQATAKISQLGFGS